MMKDEITHFTLSIVAGISVALLFGNWWAVPVALLSGFLIDVDHLFDYLKFTKLKRFDLKEFASAKYFDYANKVYLPLHGYEYAVILIIMAGIWPKDAWWMLALAFSQILHLLYDTISNKPIWPTYFLIYRINKNFDHESFNFRCSER